MLKRLEIKGINFFSEITFACWIRTFSPILVEDLSKHKMESEEIIISENDSAIINEAEESQRVCSVGTTVSKNIESSGINEKYCYALQRMD